MADTNEFRHTLRRLRMELGLSQDAVGAAVHISGSQIGHYESGRSVPTEDGAEALDGFFGTGDELQRAATTARGEAVAPWLRSWADNEARAVLLRTFEHSLIPGLLQTEAYARAVIAAGPHSEDQIAEALAIRMARQTATLERRRDPVCLTAIIGEGALRYGDPAMLKDQLEHLIDIGHRPTVNVRVARFASGLHAGLTGAFAIATLPNGSQVVYLDELVEGKVGARMQDLRHAVTVWEMICGKALPCDQSRDLILRVIDEYEHRTDLA